MPDIAHLYKTDRTRYEATAREWTRKCVSLCRLYVTLLTPHVMSDMPCSRLTMDIAMMRLHAQWLSRSSWVYGVSMIFLPRMCLHVYSPRSIVLSQSFVAPLKI